MNMNKASLATALTLLLIWAIACFFGSIFKVGTNSCDKTIEVDKFIYTRLFCEVKEDKS